jgi:glycerol-3-phosphate acyltransferase PlsY
MSNDPNTNEAPTGEKAGSARLQQPRRDLLPLPGLAAISLYLVVLSGVIILGVVAGHHYPPLFLFFAACFIAAGAGLLLLLRWAWALALGAVFLLAVYDLWIFSIQQELPALVQGLLNLVFFLYLVRTEVRGKLR